MKTTLLALATSKKDTREFKAIWWEEDSLVEEDFTLNDEIFIDDPYDSSYEWMYAVVDRLDEVIKLEVNQTMFFIGNRDESNYKGIIVRTK